MGAAQSDNGERDCIERVCGVGECAQDCAQNGKLRVSRTGSSNLGSHMQDPLLYSRRAVSVPQSMHSSIAGQTEPYNRDLPFAVTTPTEVYGNISSDSARSAATTPPQEGFVAWDPDYGQKIVFHRKLSPVTKTNRSTTPNYVSFANMNNSQLASTDLFGGEKTSESPFTKFMGRSGSKLHSQVRPSPLKSKDPPIDGLQVQDENSSICSDEGRFLTEV